MYQLKDLLNLMARLRDPQHGCPWDLKQSYASIVAHTLEEAYEVADVIERSAFAELPGELGDLLFQVVYYCQLAKEEGRFDFATVVDGITAKLVRRHPHLFPDGDLYGALDQPRLTEQEVKLRWEQIKTEERALRADGGRPLSLLDDVPRVLPALTRASKLQGRAAQVGFDWSDTAPVLAKVAEELAELEQAMASGQKAAINDELGDLLFSVVNLARHLNVNPESALRAGNDKFEGRFRFIEQALRETGRDIDNCSLKELDELWDRAKKQPGQRSC